MDLLANLNSPGFWTGLMTIIWVNVILSGDNAVVIALAARSLPREQQRKAVALGAGAAVVLRIILTIFAATLLQLPYLKVLGGILLFWIAVKLLVPEEGDSDIAGHSNLFHAIKTILFADLVMSVDNVLAVAAAAHGNTTLLVLGLLISIPLVIGGATMLMNLMERFPVIIMGGAAMIGWVAGEMISTDPVFGLWLSAHVPWLYSLHNMPIGDINLLQVLGAILVVAIGKWLASRALMAQAAISEIDDSPR